MTSRWFMNLPPMPSVAAVSAAADKLGARCQDGDYRGYVGPDGSLRANVEIDQSVADMLERAAMQVELRGCALDAIADGWKSHS